MRPRPYVGVAGVTTRDEALACLLAFPPCDRLLAIGVLVSAKTLAGLPVRWARRMPPVSEIGALFPEHPRALNLVHYSSDTPPDRGVLAQLAEVGAPRCQGFQFNGAWPSIKDLIWLRRWDGMRIILQAREWTNARVFAALVSALRAMRGVATDVLLDGSGGRGVALSPEAARVAVAELRAADLGMGIGIAGGLCASAIPDIADLIRDGVSIDAEGLLRDAADGGGNLLLGEARRYLERAAFAAFATRPANSLDGVTFATIQAVGADVYERDLRGNGGQV